MASTLKLHREDTPLIPATPGQPVPRSGSLVPWLFATLGFGSVGGVDGYYAVLSFIAKSTTMGTVFGFGALLCTGGCLYCGYRFIDALRDRNIQLIQSIEEPAAAKTNIKMLSFINSKLTVILNKSEEIDLENEPSESQLEESITQRLLELEHLLPSLRTEIASLQEMIQNSLKSKSMSTPGSALDSPGGYSGIEDSPGQKILDKLNALSEKLTKTPTRKHSSRTASRVSSPTSLTGQGIYNTPSSSPLSTGNSNMIRNSQANDDSPLAPLPLNLNENLGENH